MSRVDATGAEVNDADELNSTTIGASSSFAPSALQSRSGSRSWRAQRPSLAVAEAAEGNMTYAATANIAVRFSLYVASGTTSATRIGVLQINFGVGETLTVRIQQNAGDFDVDATGTNGVTTATTSEVAGLAYGTWHNICIRTAIVAASETITLRVNGTTVTASADWADGNTDDLSFGLMSSTVAGEVYIDDLIVDNANADIDDERFLTFLPPNTDKQPQDQWVSVGGAASTTTAITDNADGTLIRASGTTAANIAFEMTDLGGTMPSSGFLTKALYFSCRRGSTLDATAFTYRIRKSDDTSQGSASIASVATPTTSRSALIITTSYTQAELNGLYYRFEYPGAIGGQSSIEEAWGYAEIEANPSLTDSGTVSESASISATARTTDSLSISETEEAVDATSVATGAGTTTNTFILEE